MTAPKRLVVATGNPKKLKEIEAILGGLPIAPPALTTTGALGLPSPEETGETFAENALIKARAAFQATGSPSLADDSGLCVDALGGAPGVRSARYSGEGATDAGNNARLLEALADTADGARGASFRSCVALVFAAADAARVPGAVIDGEQASVIAEGAVQGEILRAARGPGGFGYDPLFLYPPSGQTFAELAPAEKHAVSHRGRALQALAPALEALFKDL